MGSPTRIIRAALLAAAAVLLAFAASQLRDKHREAEAVVQNIHDQIDALDPATRAAVVARLTSDEVKRSTTSVNDRRARRAASDSARRSVVLIRQQTR